MSVWSAVIVPAEGRLPLFQRLAGAIADAIRNGRLAPGSRLPGSRTLAKTLGVHRNTVLAALGELAAQGWITTTRARGTFVAEDLPERRVRPVRAGIAPLGLALPSGLEPLVRPLPPPARGELLLDGGVGDPRLAPVDLLGRAWRRVLRRRGTGLLGYGPAEGLPELRAALAQMIAGLRGVPATAEHVLVTRGSQMGLDLCARALVRPGDVVAIEALGYPPAWDAFRLAGAKLAPIRVDAGGLDVERLAEVHARTPLRAVYVTPHHQYPTTVTMAAPRRLALLAWARQERVAILEDDYDHEFHYDGRPVLPLASADDAGVVIYLGTLSKVLAPGLRLGFVVAPTAFIERLVRLRVAMDRQGDHPMEAAVAELLEDGTIERHIRKLRVEYQARRDHLVTALRRDLGDALTVTVPRGGISLWARLARGIRGLDWVAAAAARGVRVAPGSRYAYGGRDPRALRLVFSRHTPTELSRAVAVLKATRSSL